MRNRSGASLPPPLDARKGAVHHDRGTEGHLPPSESRRNAPSSLGGPLHQIRLWLSSVAYVLLHALRRLGLPSTALAKAQCHTIRLKLLKIGARVRVTVRKIWVSLASGSPYAAIFEQAYHNLLAVSLRC